MKSRSSTISSASAVMSAEARVAAYDWQVFAGELDNYGCAVLPKLLSPGECRTIASLYSDESHFRSHIHMARHGFGWETTSAIPTTTRRFSSNGTAVVRRAQRHFCCSMSRATSTASTRTSTAISHSRSRSPSSSRNRVRTSQVASSF
jgi:hypothetical protein